MKEFEISEKVYNEILNSKIVIFVLLEYIDSKVKRVLLSIILGDGLVWVSPEIVECFILFI